MKNLKAYHVDDTEIYAARSEEEVKKSYFENTGCECMNEYPIELTDEALDKELDGYDINERPTGKKTSVRKWLRTATIGYLGGSLD